MPRASASRLLLISLALVALIGAVYAPVRDLEFVTFEDHGFIVDNPHVTAGLTIDGVRWAFVHAYDAAGGPPAAGFMAWTLVAQRGIGAVVTFEALPFPTRLANAAMSVVGTSAGSQKPSCT